MPEIVTKLTADTSGFERAMSRAQSSATNASTKMRSGFSGISSAIGTISKVAGVAGIAISGLAAISGKNTDLVKQSMDKLAASFGSSGDRMLADLKRVSHGMVSDFDLMQATARAMVLGLKPDEIVKYMEIAAASTKATGQTMTEAFDDITLGAARQSKLILDNLGIIIKLDDAQAAYAKQLGITADALTEQQKKQAFTNAVMAAGERQIKILGSTTEGVLSENAKLLTTLQNAWDSFSNAMLKALNVLSGGLNSVFKAFSESREELKAMGEAGGAGTFGIGNLVKNMQSGQGVQRIKLTQQQKMDLTGPMNGNGVAAVEAQKELSKKQVSELEKTQKQIDTMFEKHSLTSREALKKDYEEKLATIGLGEEDKQKLRQAYLDADTELTEKAYAAEEALLDQQRAKVGESLDGQLVQLESWYKKVSATEDMSQEGRLEATRLYEDRKLEIQREREQAAEDLLAQQGAKVGDRYDEEMRRLEEWHLSALDSDLLSAEQRLEVESIYQERKDEIQNEYAEREIARQLDIANEKERIQKETYEKKKQWLALEQQGVEAAGQLALQFGGKIGEKLFKVSQGVKAAMAVVDTHAAIMQTMAATPYPYNIPLAAAQAAIGAAQVAAILSASPGTSSTVSADLGGGGGVSATSTGIDDITPEAAKSEEKAGTYTINIMGDIMNEDYVDLLAEKISDAVQDRNVVLKASQARTLR